MRTPTIWAICLSMFVVSQLPCNLSANTLNNAEDPITSFWFELPQDPFGPTSGPQVFVDIPVTSLSLNFLGTLPIFSDIAMTLTLDPSADVQYFGPTNLVLTSPLARLLRLVATPGCSGPNAFSRMASERL